VYDHKNEREYTLMEKIKEQPARGRTNLMADVYRAGARELTSKDLVELDRQIVSQQMAVAILEHKAGRALDRNIVTQKCRRGQLKAMGMYHNQLYFYRADIEALEVHEPARPALAG
jgi:hypothetical protein